MSDDAFINRLSRFTPDAAGLDRAAVLFAAGRASARPSRRWMALAGALAISQLFTLGMFLWPRPAQPGPGPVPFPTPLASTEQPAPDPVSVPSQLWLLREQALATDGNLPEPPPIDMPAPVDPPLRAFGLVQETLIE